MSNIKRRGLVYASVAALACGAFTFMMFWKSKPKDTVVAQTGFRFTLPGKWNEELDSDRWVYYPEDRKGYLSVSMYAFVNRLSKDEQDDAIRKYAEIHRRSNEKLPGVTPVTMTDTTFAASGGVLAARFGGSEPGRHRRFQLLLLCSPSAVTIFHYEAVDLSEEKADERAKQIMNSISVPH